MLGNVQEWVSTRWGSTLQQSDFPEPYRPDDGREDSSFSPRELVYCIHRGGSFRSDPADVHLRERGKADANSTSSWRGMRVVMELTM